MEETPNPSGKSGPSRAELVGMVVLIAFLVCMAAGGIFWLSGGWSAAVAVCGLSVMGLGISYLLLRRQ